jgi:hypothetical protein
MHTVASFPIKKMNNFVLKSIQMLGSVDRVSVKITEKKNSKELFYISILKFEMRLLKQNQDFFKKQF